MHIPTEVELDLASRIRTAYQRLARHPGDWVTLTELRPLVGGHRHQVDAVLRTLCRRQQINLVPAANQKTLTTADRAAAVRIGLEDCHLLSIEAGRWA